jgi:serine/threonine protein phosphatase PrpC
MSGTTAIFARVKGRKLHVCNVGDSRATLGEVRPSDGKLRAVDLSHDQTPFRDDECSRVKAAGARVLTLDQLEVGGFTS